MKRFTTLITLSIFAFSSLTLAAPRKSGSPKKGELRADFTVTLKKNSNYKKNKLRSYLAVKGQLTPEYKTETTISDQTLADLDLVDPNRDFPMTDSDTSYLLAQNTLPSMVEIESAPTVLNEGNKPAAVATSQTNTVSAQAVDSSVLNLPIEDQLANESLVEIPAQQALTGTAIGTATATATVDTSVTAAVNEKTKVSSETSPSVLAAPTVAPETEVIAPVMHSSSTSDAVIDPRFAQEEEEITTTEDDGTPVTTKAVGSSRLFVSSTELRQDSGQSGVRVSFLRPTLDITARSQKLSAYQQEPVILTSSLDSTGVALGYAHLPVRSLGWTTQVSMLQVSDSGTATLGKIEGNVGIAITESFDIKGGFNGSKFITGDMIHELDAGSGYQFSVGFKFQENLGLDIGYQEMYQGGYIESQGETFVMETWQKGMDLSIHATF